MTSNTLDFDDKYIPTYFGVDTESSTQKADIEKQEEDSNRENFNNEQDTLHQNEISNKNIEKDQSQHHDYNVSHEIPPLQEYLTTSTTVRPTKRRPSKQDSICKLPIEPELDVGFEAGYQFGTTLDSRIEYADIPTKLKKGYDISLEFKTDHSDGVLFYAADSRHTDFIVLYMKGGFVRII